MPEPPRSLPEIAGEFGLSERWLREFVNAKKIPVLRPSPRSRIILFDAIALRVLTETMRAAPAPSLAAPAEPALCPSPSLAVRIPARSRSRAASISRTDGSSAFAAALSLTTPNSPPRKPPRSKRASCATPDNGFR